MINNYGKPAFASKAKKPKRPKSGVYPREFNDQR